MFSIEKTRFSEELKSSPFRLVNLFLSAHTNPNDLVFSRTSAEKTLIKKFIQNQLFISHLFGF
jgi:hypothetical protein